MNSSEELNPIADNNAFKETINTEKKYNQRMALLDQGLEVTLAQSNDPLLKAFRTSIAGLKAVSDQFLKNAEDAIKTSTENGEILRKQRVQLLKVFYEAYANYLHIFQQLNDTKPQFSALESIIQSKAEGMEKKLDINAYLLEPMQRGPRYALLVKEMLKNTNTLDATNQEELRTLQKLIDTQLTATNSNLKDLAKDKKYQFGDYTFAALGAAQSFFTKKTTAKEAPRAEKKEPDNESEYVIIPSGKNDL